MAGEQRPPESLNLFRRTNQPDFCCAVPGRLPVPPFICSPAWKFAGTLEQPSQPPLGFRERAARVSVPGNREFNPGWHTALDLQNLLTVAEAVTRSALERKESRGGHFRDDYPDKSQEYAQFNIVVRRAQDGSMTLERKQIPAMRADLTQIVEENK